MNRKPEPLDATERALADLLARDALSGPSPALDARILAAARSATHPPVQRPVRRRWVAGLGIAASLVVAVGIAWRLRPLPPPRPAASEASVATGVREAEPAAEAALPPSPAAADVAAPQMRPEPAPDSPRQIRAERESAPKLMREQAPPEPPVAFDEPMPMDTAAAPPAPAPPPPAPAAAVSPPPAQAAPAAATGKASAFPPSVQADAAEAARMREQADSLDRIELTGSRMDAAAAADAAAAGVSRALLDEEPPATADSPGVQEAWLERIRELLAAGQADAARNSLVEFRRRYPNYVLPEDLRALIAP